MSCTYFLLSLSLSSSLSIYRRTPVLYLSIHLSINLFIHLIINVTIHLYLSIHPAIHPSIHVSAPRSLSLSSSLSPSPYLTSTTAGAPVAALYTLRSRSPDLWHPTVPSDRHTPARGETGSLHAATEARGPVRFRFSYISPHRIFKVQSKVNRKMIRQSQGASAQELQTREVPGSLVFGFFGPCGEVAGHLGD